MHGRFSFSLVLLFCESYVVLSCLNGHSVTCIKPHWQNHTDLRVLAQETNPCIALLICWPMSVCKLVLADCFQGLPEKRSTIWSNDLLGASCPALTAVRTCLSPCYALAVLVFVLLVTPELFFVSAFALFGAPGKSPVASICTNASIRFDLVLGLAVSILHKTEYR